MTLIDRLPYVGDFGLVCGRDRNSAFSLTLSEIEGVYIAANAQDNLSGEGAAVGGIVDLSGAEKLSESGCTVSYSTDKTHVLNQESRDSPSEDDVMTWNAAKENAVNFRIRLSDNKTLALGVTIVFRFTCIIPAYIAKSGQDNIAWNSPPTAIATEPCWTNAFP